MDCRPECGACCEALSITSPIPGMPNGKPAGQRCVQLTDDYACAIFGSPERPNACDLLIPMAEICGNNRPEALALISALELATKPD